ncbi:MAG: 5'-methylthioadenosine/adenosylhomocysteine nucleosidase [Candidatus Amulumruptor caecigallinarius]|uniref:adenosylhomocysteine nucleosidase n=1 Tax=Candidatus Amulumruptor caecigallinarius TaxID=2109911 RepID=A0A4V1LA62_9BACT|nr:MAG: 5'-methylthioadenosine/adenosylhomocysteine nucleosidase [Candidatus Amulumruptor caecigallinarius]HJE39513.1 5'-methylthioadenosine/adenosylhomocysteine nucleosidase [Candidatus Amulumruptor caecigallinarius]
MKIAIIVAMQKELHLLLGRMGHDIRLVTFEDHPYYFGSIGQHKIIATTCGIGKVNAALATDTLIRNFTPELVINTGVAGGVGADGVKVLDVVWGERVAYHDVWCGPGTRWGEAADCPLYFESNKSLIAPGTLDNIPSLRKGLICSGDMFISRPEEVDAIRSRFPEVIAVDMESAPVMQTCYKHRVPVMVARVISDTPGSDDNISQYESFWEDAPRESMDALMTILENISPQP